MPILKGEIVKNPFMSRSYYARLLMEVTILRELHDILKMLPYRSVQSTDPQITRTDETGTFEEEFPGQIRVSIHHEKNCGYKPVMAHIITAYSAWYKRKD